MRINCHALRSRNVHGVPACHRACANAGTRSMLCACSCPLCASMPSSTRKFGRVSMLCACSMSTACHRAFANCGRHSMLCACPVAVSIDGTSVVAGCDGANEYHSAIIQPSRSAHHRGLFRVSWRARRKALHATTDKWRQLGDTGKLIWYQDRRVGSSMSGPPSRPQVHQQRSCPASSQLHRRTSLYKS
jgi:hypothetical protein